MVGLLLGLRMVKSKDLGQCIIEGDSSTIVSWGKRNSQWSWILSHQVQEIRAHIDHMGTEVVHVPRCQNSMADCLAKWGIGAQEM